MTETGVKSKLERVDFMIGFMLEVPLEQTSKGNWRHEIGIRKHSAAEAFQALRDGGMRLLRGRRDFDRRSVVRLGQLARRY